jgi:hypothetical protein
MTIASSNALLPKVGSGRYLIQIERQARLTAAIKHGLKAHR